jgi:hypothetical protein
MSAKQKLRKLSQVGGIPGLDYATRVGTALTGALIGHLDAVNQMWRKVQDGSIVKDNGALDIGSMMTTWAQLAQSYYGVVVEASRGPGFIRRPEWISFVYTRGQDAAVETTTPIQRAEEGTSSPLATDFAPLGPQAALSGIYKKCDWDDSNHSTIRIELNRDELNMAKAGQYLSAIVVQNRTSEPPLVMVLLQVQEQAK